MLHIFVAIILGNKVRKNGPNGLATAGFVCGIVGTVLCALMVVLAIDAEKCSRNNHT